MSGIFDGKTYDDERDRKRLASLLEAVRSIMSDGAWRTSEEVHELVGRGKIASIEARLRDLRKEKHGSEDIRARWNPREVTRYEYRLVPKGSQAALFDNTKKPNPYGR